MSASSSAIRSRPDNLPRSSNTRCGSRARTASAWLVRAYTDALHKLREEALLLLECGKFFWRQPPRRRALLMEDAVQVGILQRRMGQARQPLDNRRRNTGRPDQPT